MQTRIHTQGFDLTRPIASRVERQIGRNLRRFEREVLGIDVYLSGSNLPPGWRRHESRYACQPARSAACQREHGTQ